LTPGQARTLQVCFFGTLQKNLAIISFGIVLIDIMIIADGVDSELSQAMHFSRLSPEGQPPWPKLECAHDIHNAFMPFGT
jgi:hypothetical protein